MSDTEPTTADVTPSRTPRSPKKAATKKATAEKAATKRTATKKAATKKATAEKAATKKAATKKAAAKKTATKKTATKKAATKKTAAKKAATKKAATTASDPAVDPSASPSAGADAGEGAADGRTRTRTRSRARRGAGGDAATTASGAEGADAPSTADPAAHTDGAGDGEDGGGRRRRRRGGRGGRGRRGRGGASEPSEGAADKGDGADGDGTAAGDGAEGSERSDGRRRSSKAQKGRTTQKKKAQKGRQRGGADGDERLPRGGTRMAAKQARRSGGQGATRGGQRRQARPGGVTEEERRAILAGPPRTMLVTARPERTQIAVMEDRTLVEHYVTRDEDVTFVGNIYMGRVQNVLPGMEAAFIDIGKGRNGVLYAGEVLYDEHDVEEESDQRIENALKPGQKVLVQVTKDPMGTKGPRLTMHLSLAGRYVVLAPDSDLFGISRKLTDAERDRLRRIVKAAKPDGHGVIVRTAAEGATEEALTADVERLVERWGRVEEAAGRAKPLEAVYEEPKLVVKVIRDIFGGDFVRCIVDDETLFDQVRDYLASVAPELVDLVELYGAPTDDERSQAVGAPARTAADGAEAGTDTAAEEATPAKRREDLPDLFTAYDVTDQLRQAMHRKVWLPSGGYLIIESTEAMKVIDVNTGRFTGGSDSNLEEIVLKTNLEAADEIVRQLRLRDMGGMIIIDFIDMLLRSNQEQVVRRLKRELLRDRTKTRVSDVSRLGLVQMTRKNVSQGLVESFSVRCEACEGHGFVTTL